MITRSEKRKSMCLECNPLLFQMPGKEIQIQSQSSISVESSGYVPLGSGQFQNSIFNIHIHSPAREITTIKLSMPGTCSPGQASCNKVLKTLELNIGSESRKLTPVLGEMELSFETNSAERNYLKLDNSTSTQGCLTDNKNESSDNNKRSYRSRESTSDTSSKNNNSKTLKNRKENSSYAADINSIKLNKAVVVLTDISKSKCFKAAFADYVAKHPVDTNQIDSENGVGSTKVKQENLNSSPEINCCTSTTDTTFSTVPSLESVNGTSLSGSRLLTRLAEGCSFSEILNRFRLKNGNCLVDTLRSADTVNHENFNTGCLDDNQVLKCETLSINDDEEGMEGFLASEITEKIESMDFEDSNLLDLPPCSEYEESRECVEHLKDQSLDSHVVSDHNKSTTAVHSVSEDVTADKESGDSSCLSSDAVPDSHNVTIPEEICNVPETSNNQISNMNKSDLNLHDLEMDEEIMRGKKFHGNNKSKGKKRKKSKTTSPNPSNSPSSKKMKQSNQKPNTSNSKEKIKIPDEYIPLQVSGPTKFGVGMINQIKPYVHHAAKDFRNQMLFGDRNKRLSSSQEMRMYKLKQKVYSSIRG